MSTDDVSALTSPAALDAQSTVTDFLSQAGKHDTSVHENVALAVTHERVLPTEHENIQTAVRKEIHQDHYHTSVQPVGDQQTLPEEHHHNLNPIEERSYDHRDVESDQNLIRSEASNFRDERVVRETVRTQAVKPVLAGEQIHHHVHEVVQPIIQRGQFAPGPSGSGRKSSLLTSAETIQPSVIHTTIPIHEIHHNAARHHTTTSLPSVSMADFLGQGGSLTGREERNDSFAGEYQAASEATRHPSAP